MNIRNSAKAVIIKDSKLLLTKNRDKEGVYFIFPGGGQEHGEALVDTVKRECLEEAGAAVNVKELLYIREYIGKNHEYADFDSAIHQIEYYFLCELSAQENDFLTPTQPDSNQIGIEWLTLVELEQHRIYPKAIIRPVQLFLEGKTGAVYLGDVN